MKMINTFTAIAIFTLAAGTTGCAMFHHSPAKGSDKAGQELLTEDQAAIQNADANYRDTVMKHGQNSAEGVRANGILENAKNKYAADQQHVQQLQQLNNVQTNPGDSTTAPAAASPQSNAGGSNSTTTVTTTTNR